MSFISKHQKEYGVERICTALTELGAQIAPSTYYAALNRGASERMVSDAGIVDVLRTLHGRNGQGPAPESLYGYKKMWHWLHRKGYEGTARCTVERLMRAEGMRGAVRMKKVRTTVPSRDGVRAGDLLNRDFTAPAPNRVWVTDFTYVRTWSGFVYTAFVFDVFSQMIVAFNVASEKTTPLVQTCLDMAVWSRKNAGQPVQQGLIHHSDAGSQYTAVRFTEHLMLEGLTASIGSVGDADDNALAETLIGLYKTECVRPGPFHTGRFKTIEDVEYTTFEWVDWFNNRRLHSPLGMVPPTEYEATHYSKNPSPIPELATT